MPSLFGPANEVKEFYELHFYRVCRRTCLLHSRGSRDRFLQPDTSLRGYFAYFETIEGPPHHRVSSTGSVTREFADDFDSISLF
jgi:hypothetical protein